MKKLSLYIVGAVFICGLVFLLGSGCAKKEENAVTLWHWMVDRDEAFHNLAKQYEEKTGVKIKIDLFAPPNAYTQRIIASSQAKVLPDIFGILDKKEVFAKFVQYDLIVDLTEEFAMDDNHWASFFFDRALDVNRFEEGNVYGVQPGIYGVPIDLNNIQMLYNKKLLAKVGITTPPKTFDQFISAIEALKRVGINGLVSGWGEVWMIECLASNYALNIMGEEKVMATFRGEVPYTDPDWIKVFSIFETLTQKGALVEGIVTKPNQEAEQDFAQGRAAFTFNGSWCVNVYHKINPDLEYGVIPPPAINPARSMRIWGDASSFVVNSRSNKKDQAVAFLKWLSAKEQQSYLSNETRNLPANKEALAEIPEILSNFAKMMDYITTPKIWKYNELPKVTESYTKGIQSIIIGEKTSEEVAQDVQDVKVREQEKAEKRKARKDG